MANQIAQKRKGTQPSDFKRAKAKVGKRALKPANETDTSFKTASVNVGKQNVSQNSEKEVLEHGDEVTEIYSTRGRSIEDLASHLRHPAAAVRASAARGLKDAVTRQQNTAKLIRSHLAILMPVCAKCCVDEHFEVRELALMILRVIITKTCGNAPEEAASDIDGKLYLKPFIPLLMAHVNSALNSLDRSTQLDGTKLIGMLSTTIPLFIAPYRAEILPAFVGILSHRSSQPLASGLDKSQSATTKHDKKGKKLDKRGSGSPVKNQVIQSMVFLLKTASTFEKRSAQAEAKRRSNAGPDLVVKSRGRTANALFIPGCSSGASIPLPIQKIEDIPSFLTNHTENPQWSSKEKSNTLSRGTVCDLLGKLRDAFAEVTPKDQPRSDLSEILLVIEAIHLFYKSFCDSSMLCEGPKRTDTFFKIWSQLMALIMEFFPVVSPSVSTYLALDVNLEISGLVLDAYSDGLLAEKRYFDEVLAFLFSELEKCKVVGEVKEDEAEHTLSSSRHTLFDAFERLLVISREKKGGEKFARDTHVRVIRTLATNFFAAESHESSGKDVTEAVARSPAGRKCALLVKEIFSQYDWSISKLEVTISAVLSQLLQGLVPYLLAWGSDFQYETSMVVALLHSVVRRLDVTNNDMSDDESRLVVQLRSSLAFLFRYKKKLQRNGSGEHISGSWFELYPPSLQRELMGLVVMLQAPNQRVLDGCSYICARCWEGKVKGVTPEMAFLIVQSIHSVRKTIPLQSYLGFITNGMGVAGYSLGQKIEKGESTTSTAKDILRFDDGIQLGGGILCQCGPQKVLPMLQPLLNQWLKLVDATSPDSVLRARAAASVLAMCSSDLKDSHIPVFEVVPELEKLTVHAICSILKHVPAYESIGTSSDDNKVLSDLLEPFVVLFQNEAKLLEEVYSGVVSDFSSMSTRDQTCLISALLSIASDVRLAIIFKNSKEVVSHARTLESAVVGGSAERVASRLRTLLEMHLGKESTPIK